jgi:hypothetical protein
MIVSIMVMAHATRHMQAEHLAASLEAGISMDNGNLGETANGDRAWSGHDRDSDWALTLQEDALPIDGFLDHARAALEHAPPTAVSFYVGTGRPRQPLVKAAIATADSIGASWLQCVTLLWGVAVAMPTAHIDPFLAWAKDSDLVYDRRIGAYWQHLGIPVRYTWPSLVDHADGPTLLDHHPRSPRKAWRVGIPSQWQGEAVSIG